MILPLIKNYLRTSLVVLVVKTLPSNVEDTGSIPAWGAKILYASWPKNQNIKQKQYCNKFNKNLKKKKKTLNNTVNSEYP